MIVRILGEGQYELADHTIGELDELDAQLNSAIESGDEVGFEAAFSALLTTVRSAGTAVEAATIAPSDLTLPHEGATIDEVRALLDSEPETAPAGDADSA